MKKQTLLRVNEANGVPINSNAYMGRLVDIQATLKPFLKLKIFILGLVESFKTITGPTRPDHDALLRLISRKV